MKILKITVKPNSPETKIISENGAELVVAVHAPAEQNKANVELIRFLKKKFGAAVKIIRGVTSKKKMIKVD